MLPSLLLVIIIGFFWFSIMRQQTGGKGVGNFGKSHAKSMNDIKNKVTFKDVAGADEEKKELETEWVYVVRIIKVYDNGKKECVHEVVCNIEFSDMDKVAEAELKHYCSEHEGNFFATLEHICRIKE